ncbi:MAG: helix-turn-helix domain-containing protein [Spirochaetales bacterium]|nr:helix-turn-helix domain-containing protein [Spirochaetales bacterium]
MESFGEKLRATRENLGYSIEQIARDTHIAKRYLIALESEDFSIFPGETYLKGFLQNYAEYLGLDTDEMISIYKNMKIQEQPIPLDQLLDQKTPGRKVPAVLAVTGGVLVAAAIILILVLVNPFAAGGAEEAATGEEKSQEVVYNGQKTSIEAPKGFLIKVPVNNNIAEISVQRISENGISLAYGSTTQDFIIGDAKQIDLDGDGTPEIAISLGPINTFVNRKIALLTLKPPMIAENLIASASDLELVAKGVAKIVSEAVQPSRFTVSVTVIKNCLLVYYLDARDREEKFSYKGDTFTLSADRSADIRCSDGGAIKLSLAGKELDTGRAYDLFAGRVTWIKAEANKYQLVMIPEK